MTGGAIRLWTTASPFRPFCVHTADGRTFDVPHPEFAILLQTTLVIGRPDSDCVSMLQQTDVVACVAVEEAVDVKVSS